MCGSAIFICHLRWATYTITGISHHVSLCACSNRNRETVRCEAQTNERVANFHLRWTMYTTIAISHHGSLCACSNRNRETVRCQAIAVIKLSLAENHTRLCRSEPHLYKADWVD